MLYFKQVRVLTVLCCVIFGRTSRQYAVFCPRPRVTTVCGVMRKSAGDVNEGYG